MTATETTESAQTTKETTVSMPEVMIATSRLQAAAEAYAAVGGLASTSDDAAASDEIVAAYEAVLAAAGVPDPRQLPSPQRATVAAAVRSGFAQAADILNAPTRGAGWQYTDAAILEGQGRASAIVPMILSQSPDLAAVEEFLDVGTGIAGLAIAATQVWPNCKVVGIDVWAPSLERAAQNVAAANLGDRIEIRDQSVADLDDVDRFDLAWFPSFFFPRDLVPTAIERIATSLRPGGRIVVGKYDSPPDSLGDATMRLKTLRDGGSFLEVDEIVDLISATGCRDAAPLPKSAPMPLTFVVGQKAEAS
jgi:SAM-dependent methyltransferase